VSAAGDVNGDGFADLLIGANDASPNGTYSGASYVVFGKAGGFTVPLNLSTLNGANGFKINGETAADFSGRSVSAAGDVNGDGFADLLIGADGPTRMAPAPGQLRDLWQGGLVGYSHAEAFHAQWRQRLQDQR